MSAEPETWRFIRFGLVVTGTGEREFLPQLFREISATGHARFFVLRQAGQRAQLTQARIDDYLNHGKLIPDRDAEIAYDIRRHVKNVDCFAIWIDDIESDCRASAEAKLHRLTHAMDVVIGTETAPRRRCSAHFLVNMLEAYYFAHIDAVNEVLAMNLAEHAGDCENIVHPKNELKRLANQAGVAFDERSNGAEIVPKLNLDHILSNPQTCRALRTLVAWCWEAIGEPRSDKFRLTDGVYWDITAGQLSDLPSVERIGPLAAEESYQPLQN